MLIFNGLASWSSSKFGLLFVNVTMPFFSKPDAIANEVFHVAHQDRSTWSFDVELRPFGEKWGFVRLTPIRLNL